MYPISSATPVAPLGVVAALVGTLAAIAFMPTEFTPGAFRSSGLAMTAGLLIPVAVSVSRRLMNMFRAENLLMVALAYWLLLDLIQGQKEPENTSREAIQMAFIAIGLFASGIWIAHLFPAWRLPAALRKAGELQPSGTMLYRGVLIFFALGMAHYVISCDFNPVLMLDALGRSRFAAPWAVANLGGWRAFQEHLVYFGYLVPTLTVLLAHVRGWASSQTYVALGCSFIFIVFCSQGGTRGEIGVMVGAATLTWLLLQPAFTWKVRLRLVAVTVVLLVWLQVMFIIRGEGMAVLFTPERAKVTEQLSESKVDVDDNFYRLCQVMDLMPSRIDYTYGGQLFYVAVRPIPRVFWPSKPVGPGFSFEEEVGVTQATLSVTIIAELYYDFGLPFVFLGALLYGRLAGMWNQYLVERKGLIWPMLYGLGLMALFAGIRSEQAFLLKAYPLLFWLVVSKYLFKDNPSEAPTSH